MRAGMENWLLGHWYGTDRPPWFLRMLEPVYRTVFQRVQKKGNSDAARYRSGLPLIVVGNITAGGSGKTPLVIRLCQLAKDLKFRPGIASTGYGRLGTDTIVVDPVCDPRICGDEPVMLAQRTGVPVVVAKHRIDAIRKLNELDLDLIFSDDGLQQADLERDIEFCVVDGSRGLGNGHLLPAGPLRETAARLDKVDYVITNGVWANRPDDADVNVMHLEASQVCSFDGVTVIQATQFLQRQSGIEIHAVAGIGNPQRFFETLETLGIEAVPHRFPDHHPFTLDDFSSIGTGSAIIMTEKDAVKCRSLGLENSWYLPVETHLPDEFEVMFKDRLAKLIKERK
jgi:tetraacyldisaccharide 4'-kinase